MGSLMAGWDSPDLGDDKKGTQIEDLSPLAVFGAC